MADPVAQIADEILVLDAQAGDREAFDRLVLRWQKRLWRHAFNLTHRTEAAWDLTQETWLDVVRGLARLNDPARFGNWAYRIVSHKAYDWLRRHGEESPPDLAPQDTPALLSGQQDHHVQDVLRRLPASAQVVLNLYYLEGFSVAETAGILGLPAGTVKSRLHTVRIDFRKLWESLASKGVLP